MTAPDKILTAVTYAFGVTTAEISGKSRLRHITEARQAAMLLMRDFAGMTLMEIAAAMKRTHPTVIHGIANARFLIGIDIPFTVCYHKARCLLVTTNKLLHEKEI